MTDRPDTRTTENREPRTEAGRDTLADPYYSAFPGSPFHARLRDRILAIEAEAAQGAAPRPEIVCLDGDIFESVEAMRDHIELVHVGIDIPEYGEGAAPRAEGLDVERLTLAMCRAFHGEDCAVTQYDAEQADDIAAEYARLAPQERRDKEGTE